MPRRWWDGLSLHGHVENNFHNEKKQKENETMSLLGWAIGLMAYNELSDAEEKSEQALQEAEGQRWELEEERRRNDMNEQRIRKLEDELRRLRGGR